MKYTGFIKNYHPNIEGIKNFRDIQFDFYQNDKNQIVEYLESGSKIAVSMHIIESLIPNDSKVIGGLFYFTDGKWIWTNYLIYYLKFYNIEIESDFITHIREQKYKYVNHNMKLTEKIIDEFENYINQ